MPSSLRTFICNQLLECTESGQMTLQELTSAFPQEYQDDARTIASVLQVINGQRLAAWQVVEHHVQAQTEAMSRAWKTEKRYLEQQAGLLTRIDAQDDLPVRFDTETTRVSMEENQLADGSRLVSVHDAIVLLTDENSQLQKETDFARVYTEQLTESIEAMPSMLKEHVLGSDEVLNERQAVVERLVQLVN